MKELNTYGDILKEIKRVKESIQIVKEGLNYEQGDEFDLKLYLIYLQDLKDYNERLFLFKQDIGLSNCRICEGVHLDIMNKDYILETLSYKFKVKCLECGYEYEVIVPKEKFVDGLVTMNVRQF